jgi:hypothetical protein
MRRFGTWTTRAGGASVDDGCGCEASCHPSGSVIHTKRCGSLVGGVFATTGFVAGAWAPIARHEIV